MIKRFLYYLLIIVFPFSVVAQNTDYERQRDTILQWVYFNNAIKPVAYKPLQKNGKTYSVYQRFYRRDEMHIQQCAGVLMN